MADADTKTRYPLRQLRKRKTRDALVKAANELFHLQGFENTTVEQIAQRAEVHIQTFYTHFATKEDAFIFSDRIKFGEMREQIENRDPGTDTLVVWRALIATSSQTTRERYQDRYLKRALEREQVPPLAAANLKLWHDYEDLLTTAIAQDLGVDPEQDRFPRLIACMLWGGHHHAVRRWAASNARLDLVEEELAVIDEVIAMYGTLLRSRRRRQGTRRGA